MTQGLNTSRIVAAAFFLLAAMIALSLSLAMVAGDSQNLLVILARAPGSFLTASFHLASFYVPLVLCVAAVLLLGNRFVPATAGYLVGSVFPFFTVALLARLISQIATEASVATSWLLTTLGPGGAVSVVALLLGLQCAGAAYLWHRQRIRWGRFAGTFERGGASNETDPVQGAVRALLSAPADLSDAVDVTPTSLVDLPDPSPAHSDDDPSELEVVYSEGRFADADDDFDELESYDEEDDASYPIDAIDSADQVHKNALGRPRRQTGSNYSVPISGLLMEYKEDPYWQIDDATRSAAETLRITLEEFGVQAEVTGIRKGPVITMFELLPAPGVKLSKIVNLADNIALRLAAASVRIVAPIPGKHAVGIEIPNQHRAIVSFAELLQEDAFSSPRLEIPIALGKDIPGDAQIVDLTRMPHVLIAGATGSGKSVCVNSIIGSILYRRSPAEVKMILIDPKIVELKFYNEIPHLLTPVVTDPKKAFQALQYCIYEMERRYTLLDALSVRDVQSYNRRIIQKKLATEPLPYIVVVVDEFADLMATSGKELESTLARLAAMSRAVGIHLVLATQRPSTDVITGLIKANIPSRIAFMVASKVDSRIILDAQGAEKLLGAGDMLFTSAWDPFPVRLQGAYLSEEEVERVVEYVKTLGEPEYIDEEIFIDDDEDDVIQGELEDPLMEKAIDIVVAARKASASYLQRRLKIGYNRAARMVEEMERIGIVGPQQGSKPREIISVPGQ